MFHLHLKVMFFRLGSQPDLFYLNDCLALSCILELFALLIPKASVVHDPTYWGIGQGCHLYQIVTGTRRPLQGLL